MIKKEVILYFSLFRFLRKYAGISGSRVLLMSTPSALTLSLASLSAACETDIMQGIEVTLTRCCWQRCGCAENLDQRFLINHKGFSCSHHLVIKRLIPF